MVRINRSSIDIRAVGGAEQHVGAGELGWRRSLLHLLWQLPRCGRVSCLMATVHFEPPVGIYFGPPGQILLVSTAREAGACLLSGAWPDRHSEDFKRAMWCITAALEGRSDAKLARVAFKEAFRAAGILVDQKLMMH